MKAELSNLKCTYTGGGIYVVTAKYGDVYLASDLETYGTYDCPWEDIEEKYNCDYDAHWKDSPIPLPTWSDLFHAICRSYRKGNSTNMDPSEVGRIISLHHPQLFRRLDESDDAPRTDDNSERLTIISLFIEQFEEFLEDRGIDVPNDEKKQDPDPSTIYGSDYGELSDRIENLLVRFGVL